MFRRKLKAHPSPILTNGVFEGEVYDANKEIMDWSTVQISDDDWETVAIRAVTNRTIICAYSTWRRDIRIIETRFPDKT